MLIYGFEHYDTAGVQDGSVYTGTITEARKRVHEMMRDGGTDRFDSDQDVVIFQYSVEPDKQTILNLLNHTGGWSYEVREVDRIRPSDHGDPFVPAPPRRRKRRS